MSKTWGMSAQQYNLVWTEVIEKEKKIARAHPATVLYTEEQLKEFGDKYTTSFGERKQPSSLGLVHGENEYDLCHHQRDKYVLRPKLKRDDRSDHLQFGRSGRAEEHLRVVPVTYSQWYGFRSRFDPFDNSHVRRFYLKNAIYKKNGTGLPPDPGDTKQRVYAAGVFEPQKPPLAMELLPTASKRRLDALVFRPLVHG